jgi:hypothetical protein
MYRILRLIHQITGMIGSILVLIMAMTGLLLNHRSWIGYDSVTEMKLQQVIFGLHSGTVGNTSIVWLTDFGAICMMVLSITGVWAWLQGNHNIKRKRKKREK